MMGSIPEEDPYLSKFRYRYPIGILLRQMDYRRFQER